MAGSFRSQFHHWFPVTGHFMRWFTCIVLLVGFLVPASAHHPERANKRVYQSFDLIGPLGNWLPPSHRRKYNRPTYLGGKIAYWIAPSSQEAMAWHDAAHRRAYKDHRPRIEKHYFYPKPWESLRVGGRVAKGEGDQSPDESRESSGGVYGYDAMEDGAPDLEPVTLEPLAADAALIE